MAGIDFPDGEGLERIRMWSLQPDGVAAGLDRVEVPDCRQEVRLDVGGGGGEQLGEKKRQFADNK
ncbi:MAG: hypothetical protein OXC06_17705 [Acidimicrobiaceae bacterium]|nr:hypothetical protein [Acidimicrobiaceae bacterium]